MEIRENMLFFPRLGVMRYDSGILASSVGLWIRSMVDRGSSKRRPSFGDHFGAEVRSGVI